MSRNPYNNCSLEQTKNIKEEERSNQKNIETYRERTSEDNVFIN